MKYNAETITAMAKELFREERAIQRLDGWFLIRESARLHAAECEGMSEERRAAFLLRQAMSTLPLSISRNAVFAGTERDAFARSYALINPSFRVETFNGYCDPTAVYGDIEPNGDFPPERIARTKAFDGESAYVKQLSATYRSAEKDTAEVLYFVEQVTGHVIPDVRELLRTGAEDAIRRIREAECAAGEDRREVYAAMRISLEALILLASRYEALAREALAQAEGEGERERLTRLADALARVPRKGARNLFEAIQSFCLIWQLMCAEQAPNPFAFSVGNADRIFEPYRAAEGLSREEAAALFKHFLVFFNVADRSWAISQNIILGGRGPEGEDLTNLSTLALLDAYYDMNVPQPILSVKLHKNTPDSFYAELGRFFFTPGCLTPSFFNDDALFKTLSAAGIDPEDLPDISIAGCQEPLVMGKDNGNTTNSWLNLGKILEITLSGGYSTVTGEELDADCPRREPLEALRHLREDFYANAERIIARMAEAANGASRAVSRLPVPFLSVLMGGIETGADMRSTERQGTKYNGSGCLIHGLAVVADSFIAVDELLKQRPWDAENLLLALQRNFEGYGELREFLLSCPKYGNNKPGPDAEAAEIAGRIADLVRAQKNYLGNPFRPDFSTPSTHLLYGYWVGALPDGRVSRDMLNYGVDPLAGDANEGMGFRILSLWKLPFRKMCGGYASHLGIDPKYFRSEDFETLGLEFKSKVLAPLFFNDAGPADAPFYLYVNVTTPEMLRKVLAEPKKYAPNGVYIMRIHGTFVNFLDLSPAIQEDIIRRLDPKSAALC